MTGTDKQTFIDHLYQSDSAGFVSIREEITSIGTNFLALEMNCLAGIQEYDCT
jgi:hypothetical protein